MPKSPTITSDPEVLRQQAADLAERQAAVIAELNAVAAAEAARQAAQRADADRELIATFSRKALDEAVEDARQALDEAVRQSPVTQALGRLQYAQVRRYMAVVDLLAAKSRTGEPTDGAQLPPTADAMSVDAYVATAAQRIATELMDAQRNETEQR